MKQSDSLGILEQGRFEYALNRRQLRNSQALSGAAAAAGGGSGGGSQSGGEGPRQPATHGGSAVSEEGPRAALMPSPPVEVTLEYVNSPVQGDELIVDVWETEPSEGGLLFHLRSALNPIDTVLVSVVGKLI
jgi:hypothetical protein